MGKQREIVSKVALSVAAAVIVAAAAWVLIGGAHSSGDDSSHHTTTSVNKAVRGDQPTAGQQRLASSPSATSTIKERAYTFAPASGSSASPGPVTEEQSAETTSTVQGTGDVSGAGNGCSGSGCGNWRPTYPGGKLGPPCTTKCYPHMVYRCAKKTATLPFHNDFGADLFKAKWTQAGCYSTDGPHATCCFKPLSSKCWMTGLGRNAGWECHVGAADRSGKYSNDDKKHVAWQKVEFQDCLPNGGGGCNPYDSRKATGYWGIFADPHACCGAPDTGKHWQFWWVP